jgi:alkylation response protein AidB-like acyl-CoA dehydrogenase
MDLRFTPEETAFRDEVRTFIRDNLPADIRERMRLGYGPRKEDTVRWQQILNKRGWAAISWPKEHGGPGWTAIQKMIFLEENQVAPAPEVSSFNITMLGPVLIQFGTEEQKKQFLPRAANLDDWWCQGFSEPGAGSDLASLKTAAKRDGDHYVVNGQKIWTSTAHHADWCFLLVRTNPNAAKRQEGISFLLVDMHAPGVTVRPIIMLDEDHEVNEVFFDDVRVPVANLVGQENRGWTYAKYLLGHERTGIAAVGRSKRELARLKALARREQKDGAPLLREPLFAAKVADLEIELMALEMTVLRVLADANRAPGPEASVLKVRGTEIQQRLSELMVEAAGPLALPFDPAYLEGETGHSVIDDDFAAPLLSHYFNYRKTSIYGGSNEIQRNIISQMILGL